MMTGQTLRPAFLALALLAGAGLMASADTYKGYETPPYTVSRTDGVIEVRDYAPHIVAEVGVSGNRDAAIGRGFRTLAGYIFGGNATREKVAMTTPVAQTPAGAGWTVRFTMPKDFDLATLPQPKDAAIRLRQVPGDRQIAIRFSGLRGDAVLAEQAARLRAWADANRLIITAGPHYYFYDGPMTLPWNRRNEVAFTVR